MNLHARARSLLPELRFDAERRHHGIQLAAAVVIAYAISALLRLPEHLWAVMTTLIVMRPNAGGTWDAGWDRARGTMIGALGGLVGVYLEHHATPPLATLLGIVAGLSFASAASPALRSAPVAALIILGAGDLAGHSVLQVAALRVAQILIGVAVAMAVALASSRYRASERCRTGCASLLQRLSRQVELAPAGAAPAEAEADKAGAAVRGAVDRLTALAGSADRESRIFRAAARAVDPRFHRQVVGLTGRIAQDTALLNRVLRGVGQRPEDRLAPEAAQAASIALASVAELLAGRGEPRFGALSHLVAGPLRNALGDASSGRSGILLAAPLHLLLGDMQRLVDLLTG